MITSRTVICKHSYNSISVTQNKSSDWKGRATSYTDISLNRLQFLYQKKKKDITQVLHYIIYLDSHIIPKN